MTKSDTKKTKPIQPPGKAEGQLRRRGLMFVLSSPSGAGKTSISRRILERERNLTLSVSATTRPPRPGETDGEHYHFLDQEEFDRRVQRGDFLEHATVFGKSYGTLRDPVEAALSQGQDVLFDIDWQGTRQLAEKSPGDVVSIFILPPTAPELERRLKQRGQDPDRVIAERMEKAADEISHYYEYDYVVINSDFDDSVSRLRGILHAERMRRTRLLGLEDFVRKLEAQLEKGGKAG
jgi:guanylate kinase